MTTKFSLAALTVALIATVYADSAHAVTEFDQNVTNNIIFGSGNANGGFTTDRADGVELGIRGKLRFDENNLPQDIYNSDGAGSYTFQAGNPPTGFGFDPNNPTTPVWSFDWSINTNFDDSSTFNLADLTYELNIDADPSPATNNLTFDPINAVNPGNGMVLWDHGIGDNTTASGAGTEATDAANYATLIGANRLAQNSWNYEFFNDGPPLDSFDPNELGTYTISLTAFDGGNVVARTSININVVPEPTTICLLSIAGLCGLVGLRRRR